MNFLCENIEFFHLTIIFLVNFFVDDDETWFIARCNL